MKIGWNLAICAAVLCLSNSAAQTLLQRAKKFGTTAWNTITLETALPTCRTLIPPLESVDMRGQTVIITGANKGIGFYTALFIAGRGAKVILACRNEAAAQAALVEIHKVHADADITYRVLNLTDTNSIRDFATNIIDTVESIDILIHNAGMALSFGNEYTPDDREITMATNVHGPFLLTHLLYEKIAKKTPSRIIIVASVVHKIHTDKLNKYQNKPALFNYFRSKQANIYFGLELARRLEGSGVNVYLLHPGLVDSDIWGCGPKLLNYPMKGITWLFMKSVPRGAQTSIYLAVARDLDNHSGKYYENCREHKLSKSSSNMTKALALWKEWEDLLLEPGDSRINPPTKITITID